MEVFENDQGKYVSRTALAGHYPKELCMEWSRLLKSVAPARACTVERSFNPWVLQRWTDAAGWKADAARFPRQKSQQIEDAESEPEQCEWHVTAEEVLRADFLTASASDIIPKPKRRRETVKSGNKRHRLSEVY